MIVALFWHNAFQNIPQSQEDSKYIAPNRSIHAYPFSQCFTHTKKQAVLLFQKKQTIILSCHFFIFVSKYFFIIPERTRSLGSAINKNRRISGTYEFCFIPKRSDSNEGTIPLHTHKGPFVLDDNLYVIKMGSIDINVNA